MRTLYPAKLKSQHGKEIEIPLDLRGVKVREGDRLVTVGSDIVWQVLVIGEGQQVGDGRHHRHWMVKKKVR